MGGKWGNMKHPGGDGAVLYLDGININKLLMILYCNFIRCYHWGELVKGTWDLFVLHLKTACESTIISK